MKIEVWLEGNWLSIKRQKAKKICDLNFPCISIRSYHTRVMQFGVLTISLLSFEGFRCNNNVHVCEDVFYQCMHIASCICCPLTVHIKKHQIQFLSLL